MKELTPFDIGLEYQALFDLMEDEFDTETGELIDKTEDIKALQESLSGNLEDKLTNCHRYCLTLEGEADILDKEIKRLQAKKTARKNKINKLRNMMQSAIQVTGVKKIESEFYTFSLIESESVNVANEDQLSRRFKKVSYTADKTKIKEALKEPMIGNIYQHKRKKYLVELSKAGDIFEFANKETGEVEELEKGKFLKDYKLINGMAKVKGAVMQVNTNLKVK